METQYFKDYSPALDRDMEVKVWGYAGRPMLYIPCQDGRFYDFEDFHMAEVLAPWIETGRLMVMSVDTIDKETWSNKDGDPYLRGVQHERWMDYLFTEAVPFLQGLACDANGWDIMPGVIACGCSLGATHAANLYFRRPDLFVGLIALSGIYSSDYGWDGYHDTNTYLNSPVEYLQGMTDDHPYMEYFRDESHAAVICVGQGPWEIPDTTFRVKELCEEKNIPVWVDAWGYDVAHDWPWWYKQIVYFMPYVMGDD